VKLAVLLIVVLTVQPAALVTEFIVRFVRPLAVSTEAGIANVPLVAPIVTVEVLPGKTFAPDKE
jgi:hypothetical protein